MFKVIYKICDKVLLPFKKERLKRKNIYIGKKVVWDEASVFEGNNAIERRSTFLNSKLGRGSYVANDTYIRNTTIGKFCSVGKNVRVVDVTHPSKEYVSTSPSFFSKYPTNRLRLVNEQKFEEYLWLDKDKKVSVSIGNDVWIGDCVSIIGGHSIGDGAIIGAGAVVTKNIPPYAIVGGIPAKVIKYRFTEEQISILKDFKWWNKDIDWLQENASCFENIEFFTDVIQKNHTENQL